MKTKKVSNKKNAMISGCSLKRALIIVCLLVQLIWLHPFDMVGQDKFCFNYESPYPIPTIDGDVLGDAGWRISNQYVFNDGSTKPHAVVQMQRSYNTAYISFEINNDGTFDNRDVIVLIFQPDKSGSTPQDDRRILLFPVATDAGNALAAPGGPPLEIKYWIGSGTDGVEWNSRGADPLPDWLKEASENIKVISSNPNDGVEPEFYFIEMRIPISADPEQGINIPTSGEFGFYFNIFRVARMEVDGPLYNLDELYWPDSADSIGHNVAVESNTPPDDQWGTGTFDQQCSGVRVLTTYTNNDPPNTVDVNSTNNIFTVEVENTSNTQPATGITATIKSSRFGLPGPNSYGIIPPLEGSPLGPVDLDPGDVEVLESDPWDLTTDPNRQDYIGPGKSGLCSFVELNATGGGSHIMNRYFYWNMHFGNASKFKNEAVIEAIGYGPLPAGFTCQKFYLYVTTREKTIESDDYKEIKRKLETKELIGEVVKSDPELRFWPGFDKIFKIKKVISQITVIVNGYRDTGRFVIIKGQQCRVLESVNSFGYVVRHKGNSECWKDKFKGMGLKRVAPDSNWYTICIPNNKTAIVKNVIRAIDPRLALGFWLERGMPHRDFGEIMDPRIGLDGGIEYLFSRYLSLGALVGYHKFVDDLDTEQKIWQFSANLRLTQPFSAKFRGFVNGGVGLYSLDPGDTEWGYNFGAGVDIYFDPQLAFEAAYNYHNIPDTIIQFSTAQLGLRYRF
jgi:hypothetical protein